MVKYMFAVCLASAVCVKLATGFWDLGTTTHRNPREADEYRSSFFRWQWTYLPTFRIFFGHWDFVDIDRRVRLGTVCGLSIGTYVDRFYRVIVNVLKFSAEESFDVKVKRERQKVAGWNFHVKRLYVKDWQCITTCALMTRRAAISSSNALYPHIVRQHDIRLWAPGPEASYKTPFRYRVHRVHPVSPRSGNPEHCHGPYCAHQPRHDLALVISRDQIYLYAWWWWSPFHPPKRYFYPYRAKLAQTWDNFVDAEIWYAGSGYEYMEHIRENYKIFYGLLKRDEIVDCSKYLPKWWGKFFCIRNWQSFPGIQNGGPLYHATHYAQIVMGIGCFEIRYNDDKIFVFTDVRYYHHKIYALSTIEFHAYYEFAYPQWGVQLSWVHRIFDSTTNDPMIPYHYWMYHIDDGYLLG